MLIRESPLTVQQEAIVTQVMDCGFLVHRTMGPGYREPVYHKAFCLELDSRGLKFESEKRINVKYRDWEIPAHRLDVIVEGVVLVELKSVPKMRELHRAQVLSYLKTTGLRVGLLMNFNVVLMKDGFRRVVL